MSSGTRGIDVLSVGTSILCSPTVSDFGPVPITLKRDHDNRVVSRMSQGNGKGGQWPMIQSNVVLKSLQPIVICRPMGAHIKEKCIYIRLCIRLIHTWCVFGSIVRDSQGDKTSASTIFETHAQSFCGYMHQTFCRPKSMVVV